MKPSAYLLIVRTLDILVQLGGSLVEAKRIRDKAKLVLEKDMDPSPADFLELENLMKDHLDRVKKSIEIKETVKVESK